MTFLRVSLLLGVALVMVTAGTYLLQGGRYVPWESWEAVLGRTSSATPQRQGGSTSSLTHATDQPVIEPPISGELATCQMLPQKPRMLSPEQIDHPSSPGRLLLPNGHAVGCDVPKLWIPAPNGGAPSFSGQVILVSVTQQWLWAYQDSKLVFATPVTTGMPWLWTPLGLYHITSKVADTVFYSLWPPGSPFYYSPEHVDFALFFRQKGFYIHDAPWRQAFGPGTEVPHTDPNGAHETGSHGCVNVTYAAAKWLYNWTVLGATVDIIAS